MFKHPWEFNYYIVFSVLNCLPHWLITLLFRLNKKITGKNCYPNLPGSCPVANFMKVFPKKPILVSVSAARGLFSFSDRRNSYGYVDFAWGVPLGSRLSSWVAAYDRGEITI